MQKKCGEIFISEDDLFNFLCTLCECSFGEIENFFVHFRRVHTENKKCDTEKHIGNDSSKPKEKCYLEKTDFESKLGIATMDEIQIEIPLYAEEISDPLCTSLTEALIEKSTNNNLNPQIALEKNLYNNVELFKCDICDLTFETEIILNAHKMEHGEKKFPCGYCGASFFNARELRYHERIHTGEKLYKCNLCDKSFVSSSSFNYHQKIHSGIRPYQCQLCPKSFNTLQRLKEHNVVHTEKKRIDSIIKNDCNLKSSVIANDSVNVKSSQCIEKTVDMLSTASSIENLEKEESFSHRMNLLNEELNGKNDSNNSTSPDVGNLKLQSFDAVCSDDIEKKSSRNREDKNIENSSNVKSSNDRKKNIVKLNCVDCGREFSTERSLMIHKKYPMRCIRIIVKNNKEAKKSKKQNAAQINKRTCKYCDRIFSTLRQRMSHERNIHTGELPFQCNTCSKRFAFIGILNRHKRQSKCKYKKERKQKENNIENSNKEKSLNNTESNNLNVESDEKNKLPGNKYEEDIKNGNNLIMLNRENTESSVPEETIECDVYSTKSEYSYNCEICKRGFASKARLLQHKSRTLCNIIENLLPDQSNQYDESIGNESSSTQLKSQIISGIDSTKEKMKCEICNKEFNLKDDLIHHLRNSVDCLKTGVEKEKSSIKGRHCRFCGRMFRNPGKRKEHERIHTGEKPYQCKTCGKLFRGRPQVWRHEQSHNTVKQLECDVCNLIFKSKVTLQSHKVRHGEKKFPCGYCGMSFFNVRELRYHERTHTGEKPYKCNLCDKSFVSSSSFNYHQKIHSDRRPYQCQLCSLSFHTLQRLKRHKVVHAGEKPYI